MVLFAAGQVKQGPHVAIGQVFQDKIQLVPVLYALF